MLGYLRGSCRPVVVVLFVRHACGGHDPVGRPSASVRGVGRFVEFPAVGVGRSWPREWCRVLGAVRIVLVGQFVAVPAALGGRPASWG